MHHNSCSGCRPTVFRQTWWKYCPYKVGLLHTENLCPRIIKGQHTSLCDFGATNPRKRLGKLEFGMSVAIKEGHNSTRPQKIRREMCHNWRKNNVKISKRGRDVANKKSKVTVSMSTYLRLSVGLDSYIQERKIKFKLCVDFTVWHAYLAVPFLGKKKSSLSKLRKLPPRQKSQLIATVVKGLMAVTVRTLSKGLMAVTVRTLSKNELPFHNAECLQAGRPTSRRSENHSDKSVAWK